MALSSGLSKLGPRAVLAGAAGAFGSLDTAVNVAFPDLVDDFGLAVGDLPARLYIPTTAAPEPAPLLVLPMPAAPLSPPRLLPPTPRPPSALQTSACFR